MLFDIRDIRSRVSAGSFEFSAHAHQAAIERDISKNEIIEAGEILEVVEEYPNDKYSPSCLTLGFTLKGRALHLLVCYTKNRNIKIITLYEPEPGKWFQHKVRR